MSMTATPNSIVPVAGPASLAEVASVAVDGFADPDWLRTLRGEALERFHGFGLPKRTDEEWTYTSVKRIADTAFRVGGDVTAMPAESIARIAIALDGAVRVVFVDGAFAPEHSTLDELPEGVTILPIERAVESFGDLLQPVLTESFASARDGFEALSGALMGGGILVHVSRGTAIETPILVSQLRTGAGGPRLTCPRTVVIAEPESRVRIVEDHASLVDDAGDLTNAFTDVVVGAGANVEHSLLERQSTAAFHVSTIRARQERDSMLTAHRMILGGGLVRNNITPILAGENAECVLNGLFVGGGEQHLDNHMRVVHEAPHCRSRQYYRGLLDDRSKGVFTGRIVVVQDAQKTDAIQSNDNLLLSPTAQVWTKPQLEIYADDVRCTHGATTGQLDENATFYLRARGLSRGEARLLLLTAFARENIERIAIPALRDLVAAEVDRRLARAVGA
jgi:Fe-S cluster assembly protein SufD